MDSLEHQIQITTRHLYEQVNRLHKIKEKINQLIAPELAQMVQVAKHEKQTLTLMADNASVATHVKLIAPELVEGLKKIGPELNITAIKCKVSKPRGEVQLSKNTSANPISEDSIQSIQSAAKSVKNERLRRALESLSKG